ncbi:STAS domain-containing protein [Blastococcus haudaquaticus]|uniref:Anti-anti-sigma factor n=1 Tax=Blastococcus haudaquaticus TaxID=1938745 RepID=A0A286GRD4_9ACTN|nr:STAS domain-containing protein [Blastococcus haudaquaticus]SOD97726.1 anti-anti-sigma factor [Blastococcus haudaquaticus]
MTSLSSRPAPPAPVPEPTAFTVLVHLARGRITVRGDLDRAHVSQLLDAVDVLSCSHAAQWTIDAAGITFFDVAGLRGLLHARAVAEQAGCTLVVTRPGGMLARMLALAEAGTAQPRR